MFDNTSHRGLQNCNAWSVFQWSSDPGFLTCNFAISSLYLRNCLCHHHQRSPYSCCKKLVYIKTWRRWFIKIVAMTVFAYIQRIVEEGDEEGKYSAFTKFLLGNVFVKCLYLVWTRHLWVFKQVSGCKHEPCPKWFMITVYVPQGIRARHRMWLLYNSKTVSSYSWHHRINTWNRIKDMSSLDLETLSSNPPSTKCNPAI